MRTRDGGTEASRYSDKHACGLFTRIAPVTLGLDEGWISNLFVALEPSLLSPIVALLQGFEQDTHVFVKNAEW